MKKNGFTLVEILAVIVIITILLMLTVPTLLGVIERSKQNTYDLQEKHILSAAKIYVTANLKTITQLKTPGGTYNVTLRNLSDAGYIKLPIKNPLTKVNFNPVTTLVTILARTNGSLGYTLAYGNPNTPDLVLLGNNPDTIACVSTGNYTDLGADVDDPLDANAANVYSATIIPKKNAGTFSLPYTYTNSESLTANASRSVSITNTNLPTITITGNPTTITIYQGDSFTAPTATATDVCEGALTVNINSNVNPAVIGSYSVIYTATNLGGTTKTKTVTVSVISDQPTLTILGANPTSFACTAAGNYVDPQADVTDPLNPAAPNINSTTTLPKKNAGVFQLPYTYTNAHSKTANANRQVTITNANVPSITITGGITTMTLVKNSAFTAPASTGTDTCEGTITVNVSSTVVMSVAGTYTVTYNASNLGGVAAPTKTVTVYVVESSYTFSATGAQQTFTSPGNAVWEIRLWGAEGGAKSSSIYGGKGAYAKGNISLTYNSVIYVYVGGNGDNAVNTATFNGGGPGGGTGSSKGSSGGGATDIRQGGTALANIVLVAAGGGGSNGFSSYTGPGGYGGSTTGLAGQYTTASYNGSGATQATFGAKCTFSTTGTPTNGALGIGGNGGYYSTTYGAGGGGGGYYGGGGACERHGGGGGGSSWANTGVISSSLLTAGNASMPTWDGGSTMTGNGSQSTAEIAGYARITFVSSL